MSTPKDSSSSGVAFQLGFLILKNKSHASFSNFMLHRSRCCSKVYAKGTKISLSQGLVKIITN